MIRKDAKLSSRIFDKNIEMKAIRDGYGLGVIEAAKRKNNVIVLCADLTDSTRNMDFKKMFPDRFVQIGVQEQLLAAVGAGMALVGKVPYITSYAMFCPGRAWEQVRTNICLNNTNVKVIGSHAGVSVGPDGATHQAIEDIAIMRCIPNMKVIVPCDAIEAKKATNAIADINSPCYVRLAREKTPVITTEETPFKIGKATIFREGRDVVIIACGPVVYQALRAAQELSEKNGIEVMIINSHTIKPLDEKTILEGARKCGAVVTVEEHQIMGGMGSAVAEFLVKKYPLPVEMIGIKDRFGESGSPDELLEFFGLTHFHIIKAVKKVLARKK